jgi:ATP/ADP translocase
MLKRFALIFGIVSATALARRARLSAWRSSRRDDIETEEYGEYLMRAFSLAAVVMLLASPAFAQIPNLNLLQDNKPAKSQEEKDAEAAREKAYRDSLKKIPDAKAPADPWGNVRSTDAPKAPATSASSVKPKAKTGSSAN